MIVSILIILFSSALLVWSLRYTCILLLQNTILDAKGFAAAGAHIWFADSLEELNAGGSLDLVQQSLERDYRLLLYLLDHASGLQVTAWEDRLLIWDYRLMRCWCALARIALPGHTRAVLSEMLNVGIVLSARMTERAGISVET